MAGFRIVLKVVCVLALLAGGLRMIGILLPANLARNPQGRDFVQDWSSARNYFESRPIYTDLSETLPGYLGQSGPLYFQVNAHPPGSVLITLPLGRMPFQQAFLAWQAISLAALLLAIWLIVRQRDLGCSYWTAAGILALLLWSKVFQRLNFMVWLIINSRWV